MDHQDIHKKIMDNLNEIEALDSKSDNDSLIETLSKEYNVPPEMIELIIAEWSAGKETPT